MGTQQGCLRVPMSISVESRAHSSKSSATRDERMLVPLSFGRNSEADLRPIMPCSCKPLDRCRQMIRCRCGRTIVVETIIERTLLPRYQKNLGMRPSLANQPACGLKLERGERVMQDRHVNRLLRRYSPQLSIVRCNGETEACSIKQRVVNHAAAIHRTH